MLQFWKKWVCDVTWTRDEFSRGEQMTDSEQITASAVVFHWSSDPCLRVELGVVRFSS